MDRKIESGLLVGRPFGGRAILFKTNLLKYVRLIEYDAVYGRHISLRYHYSPIDLIIIHVYFPCFKTSPEYTIECSSLIACLENVVNDFPNNNRKHIISGHYNFSCVDNSVGYNIFEHIPIDYDLVCYDNLNPLLSKTYTYCHNNSLSHFS